MTASRFKAVAWLGVAALAAAAQDAPRSILPGDAPPPAEPPAPRVIEPLDPPTSILPPALDRGPPPGPPVVAPPPPFLDAPPPAPVQGGLVQNPPPDPLAAPVAGGADLGRHGVLTPAAGGYGPDVFTGSDGVFLAGVMDRIDAPIASRWAAIVLARAVASISVTPANVRPGDWTAARARLLTRIGQVQLAKRIVDPVGIDQYTPALYAAVLETNYAAGDLAANCPIAVTGQTLSRSVVWRLSAAMCAAFEGDDIGAARAFDALREEKGLAPFDVSLAEFVASRLGGARSANLAWEEVDRLNAYRAGVSQAAGLDVPEDLVRTAAPPLLAWAFRAPGLSDTARAAAAPAAAAQGAIGSGEFMAFYAALAGRAEAGGVGGDTPQRLRIAYAGGAPDRVEAMRALWQDEALGRYPAYVLTAEPALRLRPDRRFADASPDLMRACAAGGRIDRALLWWPIAEAAGGAAAQRAWAQAAAAGAVDLSPGRFREWLEAERDRVGAGRADARARLLLAALMGLGRTVGGGYDPIAADLRLARIDTGWSRALAAAAAAGRRGDVAVLAATGLQASSWLGVPPDHLRQIVAAYDKIGLRSEARLLAAEAMSRV